MKTAFTENDIRPDNLAEKQQIAMTDDIETLLSAKDHFVSVKCPACQSVNYSKKFDKYTFKYVECSDCQTIFMNPRPTEDILNLFYATSKNYAYWSKYIFPASEQIRRDKIFKPRVDRVIDLCNKYRVPPNALLEIGTGFGTFCQEMNSRHYFHRIVGVEPTPDLAKACRAKGIEIIEAPIERVKSISRESFDVVVSFEVIEHIFDPNKFVVSCHSLLTPNGMIVLTCPNGRGFDVMTLGPKSKAVDHEHLNYFNPDSLARLLSNCGFKVLETFTPGILDAELVRKAILAGDYDISNQPLLKAILIDNWESLGNTFQRFITESGLSSNMWIVAQKN